jgi:hypothetical protein
MILPGRGQVVSLGIKELNWLGPQFESPPADNYFGISAGKFCEGWLRQPTKRSEIV